MRRAAWAGVLACAGLAAPAPAQDRPPVNAGTDSGQKLTAPPVHEEFSLVIFGDRTGGKPAGLKVLAQAVAMTNILAPAFVMTVGDLVNGYNEPDAWLAQMREYKAIVGELRMPWYPVAGNHDVYARPRRPQGHIPLYQQHFGPLYYAFDYRFAHFVVLFSDEALDFHDPARTQNLSPEQQAWLARDLAATKAAQVYVFLHHPRWLYPGTNWPAVHQLLKDDGRVRAVFAGHIHQYRDDGVRDGIHYYTLATTGADKGSSVAAFDHVDLVRVRRDGYAVAVLPVPSVLGPDVILGRELDDIARLGRGDWIAVEGQATLAPEQPAASTLTLVLANPTDRDLEFWCQDHHPEGWVLEHVRIAGTLGAGQTIRFPIAVTAPILVAGQPAYLSFTVGARYVLKSGRRQDVRVWRAARLEVAGVTEAATARPHQNQVLVLDGTSAIRVDCSPSLEDIEALTLECWVRGAPPAPRVALCAKTESSGFGLFWCAEGRDRPTAALHLVGRGYVTLAAPQPWDWTDWTHLAVTHDGRTAELFVNGRSVAETEAVGALTQNRQPLYVGADPDKRGRPYSFFTGQLDEVRLSRVVRYTGPFRPARVHKPDDDTLLLLHFDAVAHGYHPDDSGRGHHGTPVGAPALARGR